MSPANFFSTSPSHLRSLLILFYPCVTSEHWANYTLKAYGRENAGERSIKTSPGVVHGARHVKHNIDMEQANSLCHHTTPFILCRPFHSFRVSQYFAALVSQIFYQHYKLMVPNKNAMIVLTEIVILNVCREEWKGRDLSFGFRRIANNSNFITNTNEVKKIVPFKTFSDTFMYGRIYITMNWIEVGFALALPRIASVLQCI